MTKHIEEISGRSIFGSGRFFYHVNYDSHNAGWFFNTRGYEVHGPYVTRDKAEISAQIFIEEYKNENRAEQR